MEALVALMFPRSKAIEKTDETTTKIYTEVNWRMMMLTHHQHYQRLPFGLLPFAKDQRVLIEKIEYGPLCRNQTFVPYQVPGQLYFSTLSHVEGEGIRFEWHNITSHQPLGLKFQPVVSFVYWWLSKMRWSPWNSRYGQNHMDSVPSNLRATRDKVGKYRAEKGIPAPTSL